MDLRYHLCFSRFLLFMFPHLPGVYQIGEV